jgi:hypothetical protein
MKIILSIVIFIFVTANAYSEGESTFSNLKKREIYFYLADELYKQESKHSKLKSPETKLFKNIYFEYSFVSIIISEKPFNKEIRLSMKISKQFNILEIWHKDSGRIKPLEEFMHNFEKKENQDFSNPWFSHLENNELINYLNIADKIAKSGSQCSSGDEYSPWLYSKISIFENKIELEQINYWNAKSLDKNNYSMRKLFMTIPIKHNIFPNTLNLQENHFKYQLGKLFINFSDHSSPSYKECGEKIKSSIEQEMENYK